MPRFLGKVINESGGFQFSDGTSQTTAAVSRAAGSVLSKGFSTNPDFGLSRRTWGYQKTVGAASVTAISCAAGTANQTPTAVQDARGDWLNYATPATASSIAGLSPPAYTFTSLQLLPISTMVVEFPASADYTTAGCVWCGLTGSDIRTQTTGASRNFIGFRVLNTDTNWQVFVNNNNASAPATVDTGVPVAALTKYILRIDGTNPASLKFFINNSLVATVTSNIPATTTQFGITVTNFTSVATAKSIRISLMQVEQVA